MRYGGMSLPLGSVEVYVAKNPPLEIEASVRNTTLIVFPVDVNTGGLLDPQYLPILGELGSIPL